jgi:hypothetical protein
VVALPGGMAPVLKVMPPISAEACAVATEEL